MSILPMAKLPQADDLAHRFCRLPWEHAEVHANGSVYVCCPRYTDRRAIGNFFTQGFEEIWNSATAITFRESIIDGSFAMCNKDRCPFIAGGTLPRRSALSAEMKSLIDDRRTVMERGPTVVKLVHDDSCNLACPSCRDRVVVAKRERQAELDRVLKTFIVPFLKDCRHLILAGDGDPFASKHYRDIMVETAVTAPQMRIGLHTNAVLCDERAWRECYLDGRVGGVSVSIDAACEDTYTITRRGGDWHRLMENLGMLAEKRRRAEISHLALLFVVQTTNFREIPPFVELGERFGVDSVNFTLIEHWGRAGAAEAYKDQCVFTADHPLHGEFRQVLEDPRLDSPIARLGELLAFRK